MSSSYEKISRNDDGEAEQTHSKAEQLLSSHLNKFQMKLALALAMAMVVFVAVHVAFIQIPIYSESALSSTDALNGPRTTVAAECLSPNLEEKLDAIISNSRQIFLTMPAKGAGTHSFQFTRECMQEDYPDYNFWDMQQAFNVPAFAEQSFRDSPKVPPILSGHLNHDKKLVNLIVNSPRKDLIIYIHREEESRKQSGIKYIAAKRICSKKHPENSDAFPKDSLISLNDTHCIIDEEEFLNLVKTKHTEIGTGGVEILTCDLYDAIEQNEPNMIFINFLQVDQLLKVLAKHYCPELLDEMNLKEDRKLARMAKGRKRRVETKGETLTYLQLKSGETVEMHDWLNAKGAALDWALQMNQAGSCQAKTRHMEDELFRCPDEMIKVSSEASKNWRRR